MKEFVVERIGESAWNMLVVNAPIDGLGMVVGGGLLLIATLVAVSYFVRTRAEHPELSMAVSTVSVFTTIGSICLIFSGVAHIINPEFYALRKAFRTLYNTLL